MKFSAKVIPKFNYKKFTDANKNIDRIMQQANGMAALEIRNEAVSLLANNSDGTPQMRYMPKRTVMASNPGDPPNSDTGRLMQSIKVVKDGNAYLVGTNVMYGAYLEFGTQDMKPRPWLSVAVLNMRKFIGQFYEKAYENFRKGL
jgi:phage gpG-like protein